MIIILNVFGCYSIQTVSLYKSIFFLGKCVIPNAWKGWFNSTIVEFVWNITAFYLGFKTCVRNIYVLVNSCTHLFKIYWKLELL